MNTSPSPTRNHRARWAAIGAAVAVSFGAGGIGLANATSPDGASTLVPIDPCRILDTRTNQDIGDKTGGFGPSDTHTVQTQGANTGQCDPLPSGITGLALNVTAVGASELTHLTFWASGPVPNSSSLNPAPGQPPTPNAVTVDVANNGSFRVFNFAGNVHLIIDVLGYYTDHHHDDRYYTKAQSDDRYYTQNEVDALVAPFVNSVAASASGDQNLTLEFAAQVVRSVSLMPPADGQVIVNSSNYVLWTGGTAHLSARCTITTDTTIDSAHLQIVNADTDNRRLAMSATRGFNVTEGDLFTVNLVCDKAQGEGSILDSALTAIFAPS